MMIELRPLFSSSFVSRPETMEKEPQIITSPPRNIDDDSAIFATFRLASGQVVHWDKNRGVCVRALFTYVPQNQH